MGIIFNLGSGKSLLAFILENRRAVAIVKHKAHRDFHHEQLIRGGQDAGSGTRRTASQAGRVDSMGYQEGQHLSAGSAAGTKLVCCS